MFTTMMLDYEEAGECEMVDAVESGPHQTVEKYPLIKVVGSLYFRLRKLYIFEKILNVQRDKTTF